MKEYTCCFTGHRFIPYYKKTAIKKCLYETTESLIKQGVIYFGTGGALGFDTIAAQTVLKLRKLYPHVKLILVLPCRDQTDGWKKSDIKIYEKIKNSADKYIYISDTYKWDCMYKRNRHLVENSKFCVCYLNMKKSGTAFTVRYAQNNGLTVINIADQI